jgi:hypothetical protein
MQHKSFGVLLFTIFNISFKKFHDQMESPYLRGFRDLSAGLNVIDRISLSALEGWRDSRNSPDSRKK